MGLEWLNAMNATASEMIVTDAEDAGRSNVQTATERAKARLQANDGRG